MKKLLYGFLLLACVLCGGMGGGFAVAETKAILSDSGVVTAFPDEWVVVTPDNAGNHLRLLGAGTVEEAAKSLAVDGVQAVAFSPEGDVSLWVIALPGDETAALYYDVERYTPDMRAAIRNDFLDRTAWALTGYRYAEAEWTNKSSQGRLLRLAYTVRYGEETVLRGRQAYTIRNGMAFTLDLQVRGRAISSEDERLFERFVEATVFPVSENMPLLPVGLVTTTVIPEETNKAEITVRGQTMKGAEVTAWLKPDGDGDAAQIGRTLAGSGGIFALELTLPEQGEYWLYLFSSLEGYAESNHTSFIDYNATRLPVTFTSYPQGDVYDAKVIISGKTLPGVSIQCMEGDVNKKAVTGSDGVFSFTLDRGIVGERTVVLSMDKKNYDHRRFEIHFNRQWEMEDYIKYLADKLQALSYKNLSENAEKFVGRLVKYEGQVISVSSAGERQYVQFALRTNNDGSWADGLVAVADGMEITLNEGDRATLYIEVTDETYAFSQLSADGQVIDMDLPSVKLLAYQKN